MGRKVHDRVDFGGGQQPRHQGVIAHVPDNELAGRHRLPEASAQIVEYEDLLPCRRQLLHHVAADVAGATGYQDGSPGQDGYGRAVSDGPVPEGAVFRVIRRALRLVTLRSSELIVACRVQIRSCGSGTGRYSATTSLSNCRAR